MKPKQRKQLKQVFDLAFRINIEDILEKKITSVGQSAHIILPRKHRGKRAKVVIYGE